MNASVVVLNRHTAENDTLRAMMRDWEDIEFVFFTRFEEARTWLELVEYPVTAVILGPQEHGAWRALREMPATRTARLYSLGFAPPAPAVDLNASSDSVLFHPLVASQVEEKITSLVPVNRRKTALLVDETSEARDGICRALGALGFLTVFQADEAAPALEILENKKFNVSLVVCCGDSPFTAYQALRQGLSKGGVPVLLLTSRASLETWLAQEELRREFQGKWLGWPTPETRLALQERLQTEILRHRQVLAFLQEAEIFRARRAPAHAVDLLSHALKLFPQSFYLYERLAEFQLLDIEDTDYLEKAARVLESGVRLKPDEREAVLRTAAIWGKLDRWVDAVRVLQRYLVTNPFDDAARTLLAQVYLKQNDRTAALIELRRVVAMNRSNREAVQLKLSLESPQVASDPPSQSSLTHSVVAG